MLFKQKISSIMTILMLCVSISFAQGQLQQTPQQQPQNEAQQLYMEYNQLNQQLQQLQQQAMADEQIAQQGEALDEKITDAMVEKNPKIQETLDKRDELINNYQAAQQSGDQEKIQQLNQEFQAVSQKIQTEQQQVMSNPELKSDVEAFQETVMNKMEEINPEVPQLMNRMQEIRAQLSAMEQQGGGQ